MVGHLNKLPCSKGIIIHLIRTKHHGEPSQNDHIYIFGYVYNAISVVGDYKATPLIK